MTDLQDRTALVAGSESEAAKLRPLATGSTPQAPSARRQQGAATMTVLQVRTPPEKTVEGRARSVGTRWWVEVGLVGAFYFAYEKARSIDHARPSLAVARGRRVYALERYLHVDPEGRLNELFARHSWLALAGGYYYAILHFALTGGTLVWLYVRRPTIYVQWRRVLAASCLSALVVFTLYPVAPPRLSIPGMSDVLVMHNVMGVAHDPKPGGLVNMYAALPSLHVGCAVWVAAALFQARPAGGRFRALVWLYPVVTAFVVIGTANHFVVDSISGALLVLAWFAVFRLFSPIALAETVRCAFCRAARAVRRYGIPRVISTCPTVPTRAVARCGRAE